MKTLTDYTSFNSFLFKDEFYNYFLQGRELVLFPLGKRKERRYKMTDDEISHLVNHFMMPLQRLRNEYPYVEGFYLEILDIEDDMVAFLDTLIK